MNRDKDRRKSTAFMTPGIPRAARVRAYLMGVVLSAGLVGISYRAWGLQITDGDKYQTQAERQHEKTIAIPPPRGQILDVHGRPLAVSADVDSVWANPREIRDVGATAEKLATLLKMDVRLLEDKLGASNRFVWLARHVSEETAAALRKADLPGVEVSREPQRWYPGRSIASPVIGRTDIDGKGLDGLEFANDEALNGQRTVFSAVRDAHGKTAYVDGMDGIAAGADIYVTIDRSIQSIADEALTSAAVTNKAKSGVAIVLDVKTGAVLAMSNYPSIDANELSNEAVAVDGAPKLVKTPARNRAVTDEYEIGSVMKVFTVASALDAGVTTPNETINVEGGSYQVGPKVIRDVHHDTELTVSGVIKRSSNVGAVKIGMRLGREKLSAGLRRLGFGGKTEIELPGERRGRVSDGSKWRDIELATISFGYGITVTPLQMVAAMAAIGNHGIYHPPRIIDRVVSADGTVTKLAPPESRQVLKPSVADSMLPILASVFEGGKNAGTAASVIVPGFACGGKTGTAHKFDPAIKKYSPDKYYSSFAGLAPIEDPKIAIVVIIDEPGGGDYFGGKVAGPVFARVASESLRYLGVPGTALPLPKPESQESVTSTNSAKSAKNPTTAGQSPSEVPVTQPDDQPTTGPAIEGDAPANINDQ
jgi:cell division protein FtsI (penicillin-binding protein 3)